MTANVEKMQQLQTFAKQLEADGTSSVEEKYKQILCIIHDDNNININY
jgi:hypothetical protein